MFDYDYGLLLFTITLRCNGTIIIIRAKSKSIRLARIDILKRFSNAEVVDIKFIEYVRY